MTLLWRILLRDYGENHTMARLTQWITVVTGLLTSLWMASCSRVSENDRTYNPSDAEQAASEKASADKENGEPSTDDADSIKIGDYPSEQDVPVAIYGPPEMFQQPAYNPGDDLKPELSDDEEPGANEKIDQYKEDHVNTPIMTYYGPPSRFQKPEIEKSGDSHDEELVDEHGNILLPESDAGGIRALYGVVEPPRHLDR